MPVKHQVKITYTLIVLCLLMAIWTNGGSFKERMLPFFMVAPDYLNWNNLWKIPFWRFITPIFLHFGMLHLTFNLVNFYSLGLMIERLKGSFFLLIFVLVVAVLSNITECYEGQSHYFGGMSGVIYGLVGYLWMQTYYNPLFIHEKIPFNSIVVMLVWLVVCWLGWIGAVANWAHISGLIIGIIWGLIEAKSSARAISKTKQ